MKTECDLIVLLHHLSYKMVCKDEKIASFGSKDLEHAKASNSVCLSNEKKNYLPRGSRMK